EHVDGRQPRSRLEPGLVDGAEPQGGVEGRGVVVEADDALGERALAHAQGHRAADQADAGDGDGAQRGHRQSDFPRACTTGPKRAISAANSSASSCCAASDLASSGLGCTSTMIPSAPAAAPASASDVTSERLPAAWLGSTHTGRWVSSLSTGTAPTSSVNRVAVSNVLMPRSHRTTLGLPWLRMYSAACRNSVTDVDIPRLNSTGLPERPTSASSAKFCVFLAPTWSMSATAATFATSSGVVTSVTIGSPRAPRPWKAYGLVRGLYAPPRSTCPPEPLTIAAASSVCSRLSTPQGPAATTKRPLPVFTPPIITNESSCLNSREASLNG